jgi:hypothetical protein
MMKYIISILVFSALSIASYAQELKQDVKVVREYNPIISEAYKINKMPVNEMDSSSFQPQFSYHVLSKTMTSGLAIEPITAARLKTEGKSVLDKSYIKGGLGNYVTLFGDLNYNVLRSKEYALGLNVGHFTSDGEVELEDESKSSAPMHDTWTSLYFRRFWDDYTLSIDAEFNHNVYNYYGFQTLDEAQEYYYLDPYTAFTGEELMPETRQRLSSFDLNVGLANKVVEQKDIAFKADLRFSTFGNVTGVNENSFGLGGDLRRYFDDKFFDISAAVDYYGTAVPATDSSLYYFEERDMTIIKICPAIGFVFEGADIKIGIDTYSELGGDDNQFNIAPHLEANLVIADGIVSAFGGVKGDYTVNNYQKIQKENHFVAADVNVQNSFQGIHLFGGIKGNFSSKTAFVARVDYTVFNDEHFYQNRAFSTESSLSSDTGSIAQSNIFDVVYDDGSLLTVSGELKYEPSQEFNILLRGKYMGWNLDELAQAWHKPEVEIGFTANASPKEDLWFNIGLYAIGKRYALDVTTGQDKELKPVLDFSLGAEYTLSSKWNLFANLNNVFISKYYQWNGYPMQGLNLRAGVGYSF